MVDYWAHRHADDPKLREEDHDPQFEAEVMGDLPMDLPDVLPPDPGDFETIHDDLLG